VISIGGDLDGLDLKKNAEFKYEIIPLSKFTIEQMSVVGR